MSKHKKFTVINGKMFAMKYSGDESLFDVFIAAKKLEAAQKEYTEKVLQYGYQQGIK